MKTSKKIKKIYDFFRNVFGKNNAPKKTDFIQARLRGQNSIVWVDLLDAQIDTDGFVVAFKTYQSVGNIACFVAEYINFAKIITLETRDQEAITMIVRQKRLALKMMNYLQRHDSDGIVLRDQVEVGEEKSGGFRIIKDFSLMVN